MGEGFILSPRQRKINMSTRDYDISILKQAYKKGTPTERRMADQTLTKIHRQRSGKIESVRKKLIDASRSGNHKSMNKYNHELMRMRNG